VLALDYSGERSQRLPITAAMTIATITPLMPARLDLRFGIGAMPIRAITLRYPNVRFLGDKLSSNSARILARLSGASNSYSLIGFRRLVLTTDDEVL
jgi:hypothetical protein